MPASVDVLLVPVVLIGFAFEGNGMISPTEVSVVDEFDEPFRYIPYVEQDEKHFALLKCVDEFMTPCGSVKSTFGKDNAEEVDGVEASEGKFTGADDNHEGLGMQV